MLAIDHLSFLRDSRAVRLLLGAVKSNYSTKQIHVECIFWEDEQQKWLMDTVVQRLDRMESDIRELKMTPAAKKMKQAWNKTDTLFQSANSSSALEFYVAIWR